MKKYKEEKGITLVALIITVIILVILAAVSIRTIYNMRIAQTAISGTENYAKESVKENEMLDSTTYFIDKAMAVKGTGGKIEVKGLNDCSKYYYLTLDNENLQEKIKLNVYSFDKTNYVGKVSLVGNKLYTWNAQDIMNGSIDTGDETIITTMEYAGTGNSGTLTYDTNVIGDTLYLMKVEPVTKDYSILGKYLVKAFGQENITIDDLIPFVQYVLAQDELDNAYTYLNTLQPKDVNSIYDGVEKKTFNSESEKAILNYIIANKNDYSNLAQACSDQFLACILLDSSQFFNRIRLSDAGTQILNCDKYTAADYIEENDLYKELLTLHMGNVVIPFTGIYLSYVSAELTQYGNFVAFKDLDENELQNISLVGICAIGFNQSIKAGSIDIDKTYNVENFTGLSSRIYLNSYILNTKYDNLSEEIFTSIGLNNMIYWTSICQVYENAGLYKNEDKSISGLADTYNSVIHPMAMNAIFN